MPNPDLIPVPFAQDGQKNTIQLDRIVSDPAYRATWAEGFPPDTRIPKEVGGEGPDGLDFNGILNALSQAVVFLQKGNAYQFDASLAPYPIGALVRSNDNLTTYQSTVAGNSNDPNSNMTGWRVYNSSSFVVDNLTTNDPNKALSANMGKTLFDMFANNLSVNGYQKIPNPADTAKPFIIQWMVGNSDSKGDLILSNPVSFQVGPLGGMANEASPGGWGSNSVSVWGFDITASSKTQSMARVRKIDGTAAPIPTSGFTGRILVWGY